MAIWGAQLTLCLIGLGALITLAMLWIAKLVRLDSTTYDERYVWMKKLSEYGGDRNHRH